MDDARARAALVRDSRAIGDFRRWTEAEAYQRAPDRLVCDVATAAAAPPAN